MNMIEEILAKGQDPRRDGGGGVLSWGSCSGLVSDLVRSSESIAKLLGVLEGPRIAENACKHISPPQQSSSLSGRTLLNAERCFCKILITRDQARVIIGNNGAEIAAMEKAGGEGISA